MSAGQSSAIVPYAVSGKSTTVLQVEYAGGRSVEVGVPVAPTRPGLFTANSSGLGQGAILNEDGSTNSMTNPAKPGSIVVLYATGKGQTDPAGVDGKLALAPSQPVAPISVIVDGREGEDRS